MKKVFIIGLIFILSVFSLSAAEWWEGKIISRFETSELKNVSSAAINSALYQYRSAAMTLELADELVKTVNDIDGVAQVSISAYELDSGDLGIIFDITELPYLSSISFNGNSKIRNSDLTAALTDLEVGQFIDINKKSSIDIAVAELKAVYLSKGFSSDIPIDCDVNLDEETNRVSIVFNITEGAQTRISEILFEGNNYVSSSTLKKQISSKTKGLFYNGFLDESKIEQDKEAIESYYSSIGYIDAKVTEVRYEDVEDQSNNNYRDVRTVFVVSEGEQWTYGGTVYSGNTIFNDDAISNILSLKKGDVFNLVEYTEELTAIAALYYDNGYITSNFIPNEIKDEKTKTVSYELTIVEGAQSVIEEIKITGLKKTKEYVMRRELVFKEGDIFSRSKLITSAQNMYNTGLLSDINYDLYYGQNENGIIVEFLVTEGSQMDIQFGATFGGVSSGFPISGMLQWVNRNLGGTARSLSVATELGASSQNVSVSLGDLWVGDLRWANSISFSFAHNIYSGQLQKGIGSSFSTGRNTSEVWPLGYVSAEQYINSKNATPLSQYLMDYRILSLSLSYTSAYTIIYDVGRLSFSGGLSLGLNKAIYDKNNVPFENLIKLYGENWQFSNKLSVGVQWDGRDYVTNTTKGYILSASATYAGGFLQGLSNYIKLSMTAAGYLKLFNIGDPENKRNVVLSATSTLGLMLPQFWKMNGEYAWYDPKLGATKMEMLYIDGWTTARGFDFVSDQAIMLDNMIEIGVPIVVDVLQGEVYFSATGAAPDFYTGTRKLDWYFSMGLGIRLKISGFPLGVYFVKNASYFERDNAFKWIDGSIFPNFLGGFKIVLAISNSII